MPRLPKLSVQSIALRLQTQGPQTAADLAQAFAVDRSQISRLVGQAARSIRQVGAARRARYALRRPVKGVGDGWPVYQIGEDGRSREFARL
jgi:hypothetical protein